MKIVHICSYFNTSSLYKNYFEELKNKKIEQEVYIPIYKNKDLVPKEYGTVQKKEKSSQYLDYHYEEILNNKDRFLLLYRTKKISMQVLKQLNPGSEDVLHAHSLFANGGVCHFIKKKTKSNYIVSIRQTDLKVYKKLRVYRGFAKSIIKEASKVIFISHSLKINFLKMIKDEKLRNIIENKCIVIPNGISDKWFKEGVRIKREIKQESIRFLYQGTLHSRKNIAYSIRMIEQLNKNGYNASFQIIGGGPEKKEILQKIASSAYKNKISFKDWTNNIEDIVSNYQRNDIFIMPSQAETFGISYLEALATGMPIIYREKDGIDGFFNKNKVGVALTGVNFEEDFNRVTNLIHSYKNLSENTVLSIENFSWKAISDVYLNIYTEVKK